MRIAQAKGEIGTTHDARRVGAVIFAIYQIDVRRWLTTRKVAVEDGVAQLRQSLEVVMMGVAAKRAR